MRPGIALGTVASILALVALAGLASPQVPPRGEALVGELRRGGFVIYFRHAATDWTQGDDIGAEGAWASCDPARVRQLSDAGRATAVAVGEAIRRLEIPVSRLLSSEYCRAAETARLMDLAPVQTTRDLFNLIAADWLGGRDAVIGRARRLLSQAPLPGGNTVMVAHGNLMQGALGVSLREAGAVVVRPRPRTTPLTVAVLNPEDWIELASQSAAGH